MRIILGEYNTGEKHTGGYIIQVKDILGEHDTDEKPTGEEGYYAGQKHTGGT